MSDAIDLASIGTGSVVAPAGHGKTYAIGQTIKNHPELRILVLTHTNAGIAALKRQVPRQGHRQARIETISAFSLRLVRAFPGRAGWSEAEKPDLARIQPAALRALQSRTVLTVVTMGFDLLIVDEFQDCSVDQMQTLEVLSSVLPTVVLGDPLQAIFDFGSAPAAPWTGTTPIFPCLTTLATPYRWQSTNPSLGEWLTQTRVELQSGRKPPTIPPIPYEIYSLDRDASMGSLSSLIPKSGTTAIITPDHANIHALPRIARSYKGRVRVAETSNLTDAREVSRKIDATSDRSRALVEVIDFAAKTRTGVATSVVQTLRRNLASKGETSRSKHPVVEAAAQYIADGTNEVLLGFFRQLINNEGGQTYRPQLQKLFVSVLKHHRSNQELSLEDCASWIIERQNQRSSWEPYGVVVGTTLRLKGLEFENVILLDPHTITSNNHLYVALSRASKRLIIARTA
ncbi:superfamily I DNA/RNA helicase [Arthrobacter sp. UYCu511]